MTVLAADVNELAMAIFAVVLGITLLITYWASRRTKTATDFYAASRGITGAQNGFAIAWLYSRYAQRNLDPIADRLRSRIEGNGR